MCPTLLPTTIVDLQYAVCCECMECRSVAALVCVYDVVSYCAMDSAASECMDALRLESAMLGWTELTLDIDTSTLCGTTR